MKTWKTSRTNTTTKAAIDIEAEQAQGGHSRASHGWKGRLAGAPSVWVSGPCVLRRLCTTTPEGLDALDALLERGNIGRWAVHKGKEVADPDKSLSGQARKFASGVYKQCSKFPAYSGALALQR
ncbi:hypothetical protein COCOBI_19-0820 [Coccomyxa sp. Obi]|nr:hypothetical protein COCOBI_19-0820 [Coccomyxa sp. Obi]